MTTGDYMEHEIPPVWHFCKTAMVGMVNGMVVDRCACGAVRIDSGSWLDRNSRRKAKNGPRLDYHLE